MRIYSSRGMFGLSGDCCIDFIGNFTDYDLASQEQREEIEADAIRTVEEELTPEAEQLLATLSNPAPRRLSGMLQ